jgi:hypothetical protein
MSPLRTDDAQQMITDLFDVLSEAGLLTVAVPAEEDDVAGYRLRAAVICWLPGTGLSGAEDRVRRTLANEEGPRVNPFFRDLYSTVAETLAGLRAVKRCGFGRQSISQAGIPRNQRSGHDPVRPRGVCAGQEAGEARAGARPVMSDARQNPGMLGQEGPSSSPSEC